MENVVFGINFYSAKSNAGAIDFILYPVGNTTMIIYCNFKHK